MIADEFITIKNIMEISKLYKHSNYHNIFLKKFRSNYENYIAIRVLIDYCCELSKTNEYPKSTELDDLIRFTKKNDKAQSLKKISHLFKGI